MGEYQMDINWGDVPANISEGFERFHSENPQVYTRLLDMTKNLMAKGRSRIGMGMLFEVLRWEHFMKTEGEPFKLNNNYRAFYSRLIEHTDPQCAGVFTMRKSKADD